MLRACALGPDIDILPDKDRTELGDKVRLSKNFFHYCHSLFSIIVIKCC